MAEEISKPGAIERIIRHDRQIVLTAIAILIALSAAYTVQGVGMDMSALEMTRMARGIGAPMDMDMGMRMVVTWTPTHAVLMFLMWWVMMIAMMTPSAAPMLLLFAALKRRGSQGANAAGLTMWFLTGYLLGWAGFSVLATMAQWGFEQVGLASHQMMAINSRALAGFVMILAGLYQFTALKQACLRHCRSPAHFLAQHSQPGVWGALRLGAHHGAYCLGCCWALMALLFVGGVMNLWWIVGVALYVLAEKTLPRADWLSRGLGGGLIGFGAYLIYGGVV